MKNSGSFSRPGNVVGVAANLLALILLLSVPSIVHASLIDPPWVHAEAAIGQPFVWSDTDEGSKSSASVDSGSAVPGYRAFNSIAVSFASLEEAAVDFDRQLSGTSSTHPLGCGSEARIFYEAVVDSTADYSWDLDYVFNSGYTNGIIEGGSVWVSVQRYDESQGWIPVHSSSVGPTTYNVPPGNYSGTGTFDLAQGNTYRISLGNSGGLKLDTPLSSLQGTVSFDFNGVPEPTTAVLLGAGLMGIAAGRRRRSLH